MSRGKKGPGPLCLHNLRTTQGELAICKTALPCKEVPKANCKTWTKTETLKSALSIRPQDHSVQICDLKSRGERETRSAEPTIPSSVVRRVGMKMVKRGRM